MYAKIFKSIYYGSLSSTPTALNVFICLLVHADGRGVVEYVTRNTLAALLNLDRSAVDEAILVLESPDPNSRTPDHDGRRITPIEPYGWQIVNHDKYRGIRDEEERREQNRQAQDKWRQRVADSKPSVSQRKPSVSQRKPPSAQAEAEAEVDAEETTQRLGHLEMTGGRLGRLRAPKGEPLPDGEITAAAAFEQIFWKAYPRKVARKAAEKAWRAIRLKDDDQATLDSIMAGLDRDVGGEWAGREPDKIPHASTWLNQRRWEDER